MKPLIKCDRCRKMYEDYNQKELGPLIMNCGKELCPKCYKELLDWFTPKENNND